MIRQISSLFHRYLGAHLKIDGAQTPLMNRKSEMVGAVDLVELSAGRLRVAGWTSAAEIMIKTSDTQTLVHPNFRREDVAKVTGQSDALGFDTTIPLGPVKLTDLRNFRIKSVTPSDSAVAFDSKLYLRHARISMLRCALSFAVALAISLPAIIGWRLKRDPAYRAKVKAALKLESKALPGNLKENLFESAKLDAIPPERVTIIFPVYNSFELLDEALSRVISNSDVPFDLLIVEDASTDKRVRPFLQGWVAEQAEAGVQPNTLTLLENEKNLGFVQSVNRSFEHALKSDQHVILLNSDAFVPTGWISRLMSPIFRNTLVASTTPMSNDAEIFTSPVICQRHDLDAGVADQIDATAAKLNEHADLAQAPTGVGFCMGINKAFLRDAPKFDTVFGRGYGEEVDWCQKARAKGGLHLGVPNLFVEHRGGQSFGSEEKLKLVANNNMIIARRYPSYDAEVQTFIAQDPMKSTRLALGIAWAATQDEETPVYIAHCLGGGAENYLMHRIEQLHTSLGKSVLVLRMGGPLTWTIELITPYGTSTGSCETLTAVLHYLEPLKNRRIVYSCAVGTPDPITLPKALIALARDGRNQLEILFHDFFPVSPSYTLLESDGVYRGVPLPSRTQDSAHTIRRPDGTKATLQDWQDSWRSAVEIAEKLVVFSDNSAAIVREAYPEATGKVEVRPHNLITHVSKLEKPKDDAPKVIAVLGNIGLQKGAGLLSGLGVFLKENNARLVVIGKVDPAYHPPSVVTVHGQYDLDDLDKIVSNYGITDWLVPSIWPETFSYATHEALATGLPVHAFDIGAQGDAVSQQPNGHVIACEEGGNLLEGLKGHFKKWVNR